ncbi:GIN domain-containing protein [Carboxylicivirga sp. RSCT41]|uniref:GIN domain-containing protein n=1 Tax=Carboxylicivirga agarovorans TaxID=3417570 RepID=UPI003D33C327
MYRLFKLISPLLLILTATSCEYIQNLTDEGEIIEASQTVGTIKNIVIDAPVQIVLHNNESDEISIKGIKRLVENLELSANSETLSISHNKKYYIQKSKLIEVGISAKYLQRVTANMAFELVAPETIESDNFAMVVNGGAKFSEIELNVNCQKLSLSVYGNNNIGNFFIAGNTTSSNFTIEGSVNLNALNLECETVQVKHKSIGDCKVFASKNLNVKTYSSGDTFYKGDPIIQHESIKVPYLKCCGKLIKID